MMEKLKACNIRAMWNAVNELEDAAMHPGKKKSLSTETLFIAIAAIREIAEQTRHKNTANRRAAPESKPLTCEGCAYKGKYEAEYEYGYPSPCTACKRRAADNYVRRPEGAPSEGSDKS